MIGRLTALYLAVFAAVLAIISAIAFWLIGREYATLLAPALTTPEGSAGYKAAMTHVALTIGGADIPLLIVVGIIAYVLARSSLAPLMAARERERQFAADAAHELRSPLATIATVAQAARANGDAASREAFDIITATALDASGLIADLLTMARDPRPGLLEREPVDLAHVLESCAREFQPRIQAQAGKHLEVIKESAIVSGDERRLRELVRNLLDNALKHAASVVTLGCVADGKVAYIRVSNDGAVIEPEIAARMFDRYFSQDGNGLGLPLSRWIAQAHSGSLELEESEAGASFVVRLPLAAP